MPRSYFVPTAACAAGLLAGYFLGANGPVAPADPTPPKTAPAGVVQDYRVGGNLWLQTSAEYRACCLQTYRLAADRLEQFLVATRPARPAVVMDLDETVFDNSAFQTALYTAGKEYDLALWYDYEANFPGETRPVPGAVDFIVRAEKLGVSVVYVSNRHDEYRTSTVETLKRFGVSTDGLAERLYPKTKAGSSEKSARREQVAAKFNVLMYFGDNLRDFSEAFAAPKVDPAAGVDGLKAAIAERNKLADAAAIHWGVDWFVLPNPVYGEWDRMCGKDPKAVLPPTKVVFGKPSVRPKEQ